MLQRGVLTATKRSKFDAFDTKISINIDYYLLDTTIDDYEYVPEIR